jgi:hypothetical protein
MNFNPIKVLAWPESDHSLGLRLVRGRGGIGRRKGLKHLSAPVETPDAELPKFGGTGNRQSRAKLPGTNVPDEKV